MEVMIQGSSQSPLKAKLASSFQGRLLGLMFRKKDDFEGILLRPCNSVHTCFMNFPIDVYFLSSSGEVVKVVKNLKPWRMTGLHFKASQVLETPVNKRSYRLGEKLEVLCTNS